MSTADLVRMANQIAANQSHLEPEAASRVVAQHIAMFWAPVMQRDLLAAVESGEAELSEVALRAVKQLQPA